MQKGKGSSGRGRRWPAPKARLGGRVPCLCCQFPDRLQMSRTLHFTCGALFMFNTVACNSTGTGSRLRTKPALAQVTHKSPSKGPARGEGPEQGRAQPGGEGTCAPAERSLPQHRPRKTGSRDLDSHPLNRPRPALISSRCFSNKAVCRTSSQAREVTLECTRNKLCFLPGLQTAVPRNGPHGLNHYRRLS